MKKLYLFFVLLLFCAGSMFAQRFVTQDFDVDITRNQVYGMNFTVLPVPVTGHSALRPLYFDFYEPTNDDAEERPLVIYMHTGNFLPIITNGGINGDKADSATVEICTRLAKMGYAVASIDYRLGWNPFATTQPERAFSIINAAYRGIQDMRTAIRHFKHDYAENGNLFRVDTSRITAFGQGTGGYLSLTGAVLDESIEISLTTNPVGKFIIEVDGSPGTFVPMVSDTVNGDIYGTSVGIFPVNGDTFCRPNHVDYNSDFQLGINLGGAMADISWLEPGDAPVISFHAPNDQFAPYDDDILRVGTTGDAIVQVQGSKLVADSSDAYGNNDIFAGIDDIWTDGAKKASTNAGHAYKEALYPIVRPQNVFGNFESAPWEWWNPSIFDTIPHPFVPGLSIHQVQLSFNANMSKALAMAYIDTIIGFSAPRMFQALDLSNWTSTQETLNPSEVEFVMSPNPTSGRVTIKTGEEYEIKSIRIFNSLGQHSSRIDHINATEYSFDTHGFGNGIYYVTAFFEQGRVVQKLMVAKE